MIKSMVNSTDTDCIFSTGPGGAPDIPRFREMTLEQLNNLRITRVQWKAVRSINTLVFVMSDGKTFRAGT